MEAKTVLEWVLPFPIMPLDAECSLAVPIRDSLPTPLSPAVVTILLGILFPERGCQGVKEDKR